MSGLWNPYAFSPTGEAVPVGAPPALRIMNGQATSAQLTTAQTMFANFCMHSRLSAVPNATEQGRFPDGSTYRIVTVGGATIMELYPTQAAEQKKKVFSGLLMKFGTGTTPVILVNEGGVNAPGPQWRVDSVPQNNPSPVGGVAEPVGYNHGAWVEVARHLGGKAKYVYSMYLGQYGRTVGYAAPYMFTPIGSDESGRIHAMAQIYGAIHTGRTREKATDVGWYGFDDLPPTLPTHFFSDDGAIYTPPDEDTNINYIINYITASRSGRKISFVVERLHFFTPAELPPDRVLTLTREVPFFARAVVNILGNVFIDNAAYGVGTSEKVYMKRDYQLDMYTSERGPSRFPPATVEWTMPPDVIDPPQESRGLTDNINNRVFFDSPERTSVRITGLTKPKFDVNGNGGGPFGYRATRSEDTHMLLGLNYVGHELLARVVVVRKFRYEQEQRGDHSAQWHAATGYNTGTVVSSSTTSTRTQEEEYADLGATRLYLKRNMYQAISTNYKSERWTLESYPNGEIYRVVEMTGNSSMTYTASREHRKLYVYDPSLDLVCYSEAIFDTSWSGEAETYSKGRDFGGYPPDAYRTSLSAGPDFPPGVPLCFVVKCRGAETRVAIPQSYVEGLTDMERKLFYASFFPNSGVAPTTPADTATRTATGFANHPVDALSPFSPDTPDYIDSKVICLSGMFPEIRPPGNIGVLYRKTPETGGGFLNISSEKGEFSHRFLIDFSGARRAESVVPDLPPTTAWSNVSTF